MEKSTFKPCEDILYMYNQGYKFALLRSGKYVVAFQLRELAELVNKALYHNELDIYNIDKGFLYEAHKQLQLF